MKNKISGIYRISFIGSNQSYIGATRDISLRIKEHRRLIMNKKHHCEGMNKFLASQIRTEILEVCIVMNLSKREKFWISQFPKEELFNDHIGGSRGRSRILQKYRKVNKKHGVIYNKNQHSKRIPFD